MGNCQWLSMLLVKHGASLKIRNQDVLTPLEFVLKMNFNLRRKKSLVLQWNDVTDSLRKVHVNIFLSNTRLLPSFQNHH